MGRTDVEAETPILWPPDELTHLKRPWGWERLRAGGEGDDRGWGGWMASPTQWTWVWVDPRSWWWTGRPGVLQFLRAQRVGHNWVTELNWTHLGHYRTLSRIDSTLFETFHSSNRQLWHCWYPLSGKGSARTKLNDSVGLLLNFSIWTHITHALVYSLFTCLPMHSSIVYLYSSANIY